LITQPNYLFSFTDFYPIKSYQLISYTKVRIIF
jgi:hypothetical protein